MSEAHSTSPSALRDLIERWREAERGSPPISMEGVQRVMAPMPDGQLVPLATQRFRLEADLGSGSYDFRFAQPTRREDNAMTRPAIDRRGDVLWSVSADGTITRTARSEQGILFVSYEQTVPSAEVTSGSPGANGVFLALGRCVVDPGSNPQPGVYQRVVQSVPEFLEEAGRVGARVVVTPVEGHRVDVRVEGVQSDRTDMLRLDLSRPPLLLFHERAYVVEAQKYWSRETFEVLGFHTEQGVRLPAEMRRTQLTVHSKVPSTIETTAVPAERVTEPFDAHVLMQDAKRMVVMDGIRGTAYQVDNVGTPDQIVRATRASLPGYRTVTISTPEEIAASIAARPPLPGFRLTGPIIPYSETSQAVVPPPAAASSTPGSSPGVTTYLLLAAALLAVALLVHFTRKPKGVKA